jgi:hypothetical protein
VQKCVTLRLRDIKNFEIINTAHPARKRSELKLKPENHKVSNKWVNRFKEHFDTIYNNAHGESESMNWRESMTGFLKA